MRYSIYIFIISLLTVCCNNPEKTVPENTTANTDSLSSHPDTSTTRKHKPYTDTQGTIITDTLNEKLGAKIDNMLMTIPFVKKSNDYIDSFSNHQHGIAFIVDSIGKEVHIMAGYNGTDRFETYYNFTVDTISFAVKVMDIVSGEMVSPKEYIRRQRNKKE